VSQLRAADLRDLRLAGRPVVEAGMARTHLAITVKLVHGVHTRGSLEGTPADAASRVTC
jgi:hypothetical protein